MSGKPCGTSSGYRSGCRCDECKEWKKESAREYRRAHADAKRPDAEPVVLGIEVSCNTCGGPVSILAHGRPSASRTETGAILKCSRPTCRHEWRMNVTVRSLQEKELAL
jgi:hypothetical protein